MMYGIALVSSLTLQLFTYVSSYIITYRFVRLRLLPTSTKEELLIHLGYLGILYTMNIGSTIALYFKFYEFIILLTGFTLALLVVLLIRSSKEFF